MIKNCKSISRLYYTGNKLFGEPEVKKALSNIKSKNLFLNPSEKITDPMRKQMITEIKIAGNENYSLERMCKLIEVANSTSYKAKHYLDELEAMSIVIKEHLNDANQNFKDEEGKNSDQIEYFLQNMQMIAESDSSYHGSIVSILINLGHLSSSNFGKK